MDIEKKLSHIEFFNREYSKTHLAYERENEFFQSIREGNAAEALRLFKPFDSEEMGILSDDKLRNLKYHLIITVTLITRACIEGGMEMETAYNLSDIHIREIDKCPSVSEIHILHKEIVKDYAHRMYLLRKTNRYPKSVTLCLDYIYNHLHTGITLKELARAAGLSPSYLSALFHREVGIPVSEYIKRKRIEAAEKMLSYSDYTCTEISDYLGFCSESHFIQVFRKYTGYTPKQYQKLFFRVKKESGS